MRTTPTKTMNNLVLVFNFISLSSGRASEMLHLSLVSGYALVLEVAVDAQTTVGAAIAIVHGLDLAVQLLLGQISRARRPFMPGTIATM